MELSASKTPRIEVVDALRGFAVMAIILVHNLEHFIFPVYPTEQPAWLAVLNDGVFNIIIRKRKEKTSATAFYGDWFCYSVSPH